MAKQRITTEQADMVVRLYVEQKLTIKQICAKSHVRSAQTIYRILDARGIPRLDKRNPTCKVSISLDAETKELIEREKPKNLSLWACEMIKKGYLNR